LYRAGLVESKERSKYVCVYIEMSLPEDHMSDASGKVMAILGFLRIAQGKLDYPISESSLVLISARCTALLHWTSV
jgi:hypothetical protein